MLVLVYCLDRPGREALRAANRPAHLEYMIAARDRLAFGGPLLSDDGRPVGSVFALRVDEVAEAERFLVAEPYHRAGLFTQVTVWPMRQMVPEHPPGLLSRELVAARSAALAARAAARAARGPA